MQKIRCVTKFEQMGVQKEVGMYFYSWEIVFLFKRHAWVKFLDFEVTHCDF